MDISRSRSRFVGAMAGMRRMTLGPAAGVAAGAVANVVVGADEVAGIAGGIAVLLPGVAGIEPSMASSFIACTRAGKVSASVCSGGGG